MRAQEAGHEIKLFQRPEPDGTKSLDGRGLVEKVPEWEKWTQWADLIVPTTNARYLDRLEDFRKLGYPIFGPSKQSAMLEIDRRYGMEILKRHGVAVPPYRMYNSLAEAEAECWKKDRRYVFKTMGDAEDKSLSYVARDSGDMINTLRLWRKRGQVNGVHCMLQDFIAGVEFGVSSWVGRDGFLSLKGENVEHKKLMSGNYGPNTGETGTLMWYAERSKLFDQTLKPMEKFLLSIGHRGDVDLNCIVDEAGKPWVLEWTARLGWPAFFIMCAQHEEVCQWMLDALQGRDTLKASLDPFVGVLISIPPFPNKYARHDQTVGIPIQGITEKNWPHLHMAQAMAGRGVEVENGKPVMKDMLLTTGHYVCVASGSGKTIRAARKQAYEIADQITIRNPQIRDDIGEDFAKKLPALQAQGYATTIRA